MRNAYAVLGVGFVVIFGALAFFNHRFTTPGGTMVPMADGAFRITSSAFAENASIPAQYTCDADGVPPPLSIESAPTGTRSLALIMEDPDVPKEVKPDGLFVHWVLFNIPADTKAIGPTGSIGTSGSNGAGKEGYVGPCPPKEYEPSQHRYFFRLYALDSEIGLEAGATKGEVVQAMEGHVIAQAQLIGVYKRQ